jgi:hypothetical protein
MGVDHHARANLGHAGGCQHTPALDLDHAGAAQTVRSAGLVVAYGWDVNADRAGGLQDGRPLRDADLLPIDCQSDVIAHRSLSYWYGISFEIQITEIQIS